MKTSLVALLLVVGNLASGQVPAPPAAQPQASPAPAPQAQKKEIKDPAEYNAYVGAVQQTDPAAKISGLEAFLTQYPNSVMKEDGLELLMGTYQQAGNQAKVIDTANRLLAVNPDNTRALVLLAYNERAGQKWADAKTHAERGLQALTKMTKPDGVSDADFAKQKTQLGGLLNSVAGFSALQMKDYASAQKYLRPAVEADPNNVENVYPLALSYLTATPPDDVNGLFFIARAANLVTGSEREGLDRQIRSQPVREVSRLGTRLGRLAGPDQDHAGTARRVHNRRVCSSDARAAGSRPGKDQETRRDEFCRVGTGSLQWRA